MLFHCQAQVVLCGWGDGKPELERLVEELGMQDRVRFLGFRNDLPNVYPAADVFVFPSLHEGLPVALMEAVTLDFFSAGTAMLRLTAGASS